FAATSPAILRVADPGGASPTVSTYADTEGNGPNGGLSFAPDGTLYAVSNYANGFSIDEISGTNESQPASVTPTGLSSTYPVTAFGNNVDGGAAGLIIDPFNAGGFANSVAGFDMAASPPTFATTLIQADIGEKKILGPDSCAYLNYSNS